MVFGSGQSKGRNRLFDLGRIIATDSFLNNTKRINLFGNIKSDFSNLVW